MFGKARVSLALSVIALFTLNQENAANAADELTVSAKVVPSCVVGTATLDFGNLSATTNNNGNASVGLTGCGSLASVDVSLGLGDNATPTGTRQIGNGTDVIAYTLSTASTPITGTSEHNVTLTGGSGSLPVDGFIDPGEVGSKSGGDYTDALDVTVDFAA